MIGAEVEHAKLGRDTKRGSVMLPRSHQQLRCGVSRPAPRRGLSSQRGASLLPAGGLRRRRSGIAVGFAYALAAEQKNLGVLDQTVGDCSRDGRVVEYVA